MQAIIMAGGEGTRLRPLTCSLPKPMVPVLGKPAMEYSVALLKRHGVTEIGVTLGFLPHKIREYFGDGARLGVQMRYYEEKTPLGTAGGVRQAASDIHDTFLVLSGDAVTDVDLAAAVAYHHAKGAKATIVLKPVEVPLEYGVAVTDDAGRITRFLEKPGWSEVLSNTVNTGIYILEPDVLALVPQGELFDFSRDLFPRMMEQDMPIYGYVTDRYWCDIGDLGAYRQCHRDLLDGRVDLPFGGVTTGDGVYTQGKVTVGRDARLGRPVFLGKNVVIGPGAQVEAYSVIGDNCEIGQAARVEGSVLWDGVTVGDRAAVRQAVLCSGCTLAEGARVLDGAAVGEGTALGREASVNPGVKVWNNKTLAAGVALRANLVSGERYGGDLFAHAQMHGELNVDITPEVVLRLAEAYAATLPAGSKLGILHGGDAESAMLAAAAAAGLMSTGAAMYHCGEATEEAARFAVHAFGLDGGVYLHADGAGVGITFLDENGADLGRDHQRKLANSYAREDYVRYGRSGLYEPVTLRGATDLYIKYVLDTATVKRLGYRAALYLSDPRMEEVLDKIATALGARFSYVPDAELVGSTVVGDGMDFGVILRDGAQPVYVDEQGRLLSDDVFFAIAVLIAMTAYPKSTVYVPPHVSDLVNYVARELDCSVIRVKDFMQTLARYDGGVNGLLYALLFDKGLSVVRMMEFLHYNDLKLSGLTELLPQLYKRKVDITCPNAKKGKVVSGLLSQCENVDLTDGIRVRYDNGWVLILPDQADATCHIVSESSCEEYAAELCADFAERVKKLME